MLQKHGVIGGTLMLIRVARLLSKKLFRLTGKRSGEQLVSLGDGGFGAVHGPTMAMEAPLPISQGAGSSPVASMPLLQIASPSGRVAAPAGHFGDPRHPNG
jgi:hypothetical protein